MTPQNTCQAYLEAILKADKALCHNIISDVVDKGVPVIDIYQKVLFPVMVQIGELWKLNKINVAQEHLATSITQNIIASFYPTFLGVIKEREEDKGNVLVACPGNEMHELGARMLSDVWELEGWNVTYLGSNIPAQFIAETLARGKFHVLGLSCSLSFNVKFVKETIEKVKSVQEFNGPVICGGRIFNVDPALMEYVAADYYGKDFYEAIDILHGIRNQKEEQKKEEQKNE